MKKDLIALGYEPSKKDKIGQMFKLYKGLSSTLHLFYIIPVLSSSLEAIPQRLRNRDVILTYDVSFSLTG